ncbi:MAG: diguanylate cyclase [Fimbriimonadaceae bacterium]|nr:diguanylate cyclase [Fimbriimonadaceae bacterium]
MSDSEASIRTLASLLNQLGVPTLAEPTDSPSGFPLTLSLANGEEIVLDLPTPGALGSLDPEQVGVAIVGPNGHLSRLWGLASRVPPFQKRENCLTSEVGPLIASAFDGVGGSMYLDGLRYYANGLHIGLATCVFVLVINAFEEREARRNESRSTRAASALTRIGKSLTMDQRVRPLCIAATHEIASAAELAAVLLWVRESEEDALTLVAHTGANRHATQALEVISPHGGSACLAELVAESQQPFHLANATDNLMASELEAKICYLKSGGVSIHPLVIGNRLLGVLELIGREGDPMFLDNLGLFQTIAEHLSLALNSAVLFEGVERLATNDALTGIANHRSMQEFLHRRVLEARRTDQPLGVIMIDVDHFRSFNEEEGHDAGDRVLRMVADTIRHSIRPYDLAARYGGEEFVVVMPGCTIDATLQMAERIRVAIEGLSYETASGRMRGVSASLGCASLPETASESAELLKAADAAMYEAKRAGRNQCRAFEGSFKAADRPSEFDVEGVLRCVPKPAEEKARTTLRALEPLLKSLSERLQLSEAQHQLLRGLACLAEPYARAMDGEDAGALGKMESIESFRLLEPALQGLRERFDGTGPNQVDGPKIPLLARVMAVAAALRSEPEALAKDPGRFDPEIVAAALELDQAA